MKNLITVIILSGILLTLTGCGGGGAVGEAGNGAEQGLDNGQEVAGGKRMPQNPGPNNNGKNLPPVHTADAGGDTLQALGRMPQNPGGNNNGTVLPPVPNPMPVRTAEAAGDILQALGRRPQNPGGNNNGKNTVPLPPVRTANATGDTLQALGRRPQNPGNNTNGKNNIPLPVRTASAENTENLFNNPTI